MPSTFTENGKVECEYPHWKATKICSHVLAVAEKEDEIESYITWYGKQKLAKKRNLTSAANLNNKTSTLGNKGKCVQKQRSGKPLSAKIISKAPQPGSPKFNGSRTLRHLSATAATRPYESPRGGPGGHPPPANFEI